MKLASVVLPVRRRRVSRPRRQTSWEPGPDGTALFSGDGVALIQAITASGDYPDDKLTIARVRGHATVANVQANAAGDRAVLALGICVLPNQGPAIGVTSCPTPYSDMGWDGWLYHRLISSQAMQAAALGSGRTSQFEFEIDSKAMRKFEAYESAICLIAEQANTATAGTYVNRVWVSTRLLFKLS